MQVTVCSAATCSRLNGESILWHIVGGNGQSLFHDGEARSPPRKVRGVLSHVPKYCDAEVSQITFEMYNVPTRQVTIRPEIA